VAARLSRWGAASFTGNHINKTFEETIAWNTHCRVGTSASATPSPGRLGVRTARARAQILADGDGFYLAVVEASAGYVGTAHDHAHPEFLYVVDGLLTTQGVMLEAGDGYVAAAGSSHAEFATTAGATYLSIFKL
jgi:quercetin dioxygenase-like cupin family protein